MLILTTLPGEMHTGKLLPKTLQGRPSADIPRQRRRQPDWEPVKAVHNEKETVRPIQLLMEHSPTT